MEPNVLQTKIQPPRPRPGLIPRARLERRLGDALAERRLTLLCAPVGFGKTAAHNFEILRRLREFQTEGLPLLVGPSRKSFLGTLHGQESSEQRLEGTIAACVIAAINGAKILRVHDVAECKRALSVVDRMKGSQDGGAR